MPEPWRTGLVILLLALFLDVLELSYARILWFLRTLRFWLYFGLHLILAWLVALLLREQVSQWYFLALLATFLGVNVLSNTNIKIAGYSLVPIAELFVSIKAQMVEQAAEDKAGEVIKAKLIERLQRVSADKIEAAHSAGLMAVGNTAESIQKMVKKAERTSRTDGEYYKRILISQLLRANRPYVAQNIGAWEEGS